MHHKSTRSPDTVQRQSPMTLWNSRSDDDILDFALLWAPIGGPTPRNITIVISIDVTEFKHRVRDAVRLEVARLSAVSPLRRESMACPRLRHSIVFHAQARRRKRSSMAA